MTTPPEPPPGNPYGAPPSDPQDPYAAPPPPPPAYGQPPGYGQPPYPQPGQAPYPQPGQAPYAGYGIASQPYTYGGGRPSKTMAGWALGLALAFFVPLATLVSIGLAIAVLVRSRDGRDHGRGMAIAALVIDVLLIAVLVGLIVLGVLVGSGDPDRDTTGRVTSSQQASVFSVQPGDCVNDGNLFTSDEATTSTTVQVVPCTGSHQLEAYLAQDLPDGDFPGTDAVSTSAQDLCAAAFRDFVGTAPRRSELGIYFYVPTQQTWDRADDRAVTCMVGVPDTETTGTLKGSRR